MNNKTKSRTTNGSGSIFYDDKRNRWCAEIQWSDKNGEKHRKKFAGNKKSAVKNKLEDFKRQLLIANGDIDNDDILFKEYADNWLKTILFHTLKPTSYTRKEVTLKYQVYPYIGDIPINRITHTDIQNMVNELANNGLSYSTIKKAYEAVSGCLLNYRIKTSTYFNPCEGVVLPNNTKTRSHGIIFFDERQRKLIIDEATRKYKNGRSVYRLGNAIIVLMYTGLRIGELLALTWDDIDFSNKIVSISKNAVVAKVDDNGETHYKLINQNSTKTKNGIRVIPLTERALCALKEIYDITGSEKYVMCSSNGKQITPRNINRMFHSILKQTGISNNDKTSCGVHTLRHTFASMLFKEGCDVKVVSEILGHNDTTITENIYIHLIQQQKIMAIQNIDNFSD